MKNNPDIEVVVSDGPGQAVTEPPAFVPIVTEGVPSIPGNGPALLFDLKAWQYELEGAAAADIDKIDVPELDQLEKDLQAQWSQAMQDSLQIHAGVVATADPLAQTSDGIDAEISDTLESEAAGLVQNGADWAERNYNGAVQDMPPEAWQGEPAPPPANEPQPPPPDTGDNNNPVPPLE